MDNCEALKPGDRVLVNSGGYSNIITVRKVENVTKLHFTLAGSPTKYRRTTGYAVGRDQYSTLSIEPYDEQRWRNYQRLDAERKMRDRVVGFDFRKAEMELIRAVYALITGQKEGEKSELR